jgi:hypothetical protein
MTISATMLNFTQNQRFHQWAGEEMGKAAEGFGTMTKKRSGGNARGKESSPPPK